MPYRRYKPSHNDERMLHGGMTNCVCDDCHISLMLLAHSSNPGWTSEIIIGTMWRMD